MTAEHRMYGRDKQAKKPERLAEPDQGSLACAFQMLCLRLQKTRKEMAPGAVGVAGSCPISLPSGPWSLTQF